MEYNIYSVDNNIGINKYFLNIELKVRFINDPNDANVRLKSKTTLKYLLNWMLSKEKKFKKIKIKLILTTSESIILDINDVFISNLEQKFNAEEKGEYKIILRQSNFVDEKIVIIE